VEVVCVSRCSGRGGISIFSRGPLGRSSRTNCRLICICRTSADALYRWVTVAQQIGQFATCRWTGPAASDKAVQT
jgi:hypothetical protein